MTKRDLCNLTVTVCFHRDQYNLCWIFEQSSGHNVFADHALVASQMNVKPGGKQPMMHPGTLPGGHQQWMVDLYGRPKGLRQVFEEQGVSTHKVVQEDMVAHLEQFNDFKYELSAVASYLIRYMKHHRIFLPKVYFDTQVLHQLIRCTNISIAISFLQFHSKLKCKLQVQLSKFKGYHSASLCCHVHRSHPKVLL